MNIRIASAFLILSSSMLISMNQQKTTNAYPSLNTSNPQTPLLSAQQASSSSDCSSSSSTSSLALAQKSYQSQSVVPAGHYVLSPQVHNESTLYAQAAVLRNNQQELKNRMQQAVPQVQPFYIEKLMLGERRRQFHISYTAMMQEQKCKEKQLQEESEAKFSDFEYRSNCEEEEKVATCGGCCWALKKDTIKKTAEQKAYEQAVFAKYSVHPQTIFFLKSYAAAHSLWDQTESSIRQAVVAQGKTFPAAMVEEQVEKELAIKIVPAVRQLYQATWPQADFCKPDNQAQFNSYLNREFETFKGCRKEWQALQPKKKK